MGITYLGHRYNMKNVIGLLLILVLNFACSDGGVETIDKPLSSEVS